MGGGGIAGPAAPPPRESRGSCTQGILGKFRDWVFPWSYVRYVRFGAVVAPSPSARRAAPPRRFCGTSPVARRYFPVGSAGPPMVRRHFPGGSAVLPRRLGAPRLPDGSASLPWRLGAVFAPPRRFSFASPAAWRAAPPRRIRVASPAARCGRCPSLAARRPPGACLTGAKPSQTVGPQPGRAERNAAQHRGRAPPSSPCMIGAQAAERPARNVGENALQHRCILQAAAARLQRLRRGTALAQNVTPSCCPSRTAMVQCRVGGRRREGFQARMCFHVPAAALPVPSRHRASMKVSAPAPAGVARIGATRTEVTAAQRRGVLRAGGGGRAWRRTHRSAARIVTLHAPPPSTPQRCTRCHAVSWTHRRQAHQRCVHC
eukprot:gene24203-biopygen14934